MRERTVGNLCDAHAVLHTFSGSPGAKSEGRRTRARTDGK